MPQNLTDTEHRLAKAWYVKYPSDAYALGPYRYDEMVPATQAIVQAVETFGEHPSEVWPDGPTEECDEYDIQLMDPESLDDYDFDDEDDEDDFDDDDDEFDDEDDWDDEDDEEDDDDYDDDDTDPWWDDVDSDEE